MKIGVVGAGISGLAAARKLALAGHEVRVIEKKRRPGGKLASREFGGIPADYGFSHFEVNDPDFGQFIDELREEGLVRSWAHGFGLYDGVRLHDSNPNEYATNLFAAPEGMASVARYLSRWTDVTTEVKAGGMTFIGSNRSRKRAWMVNLTDISVYECDAVILAPPAPEAYGILQTAQDETPARRIIRHIDEVRYRPSYALLAVLEGGTLPFKGISCDDRTVSWIGNESSKREGGDASVLLIRSTAEFAREHAQSDAGEVTGLLLDRALDISGLQKRAAGETRLKFWKYYSAENPLEEYFMELEMEEAPLALVGDYFMGDTLEDAYLSGEKLAEYWIAKYSEMTAAG